MKVYTSYFGNLKRLYASGIEPVGIARYQPKWFNGRNMKQLSPTSYMLSDRCSREDYLRLYNAILENLNLEQLKSELESIGRDVALCCYEKPEDFCHRHLLADFLNKHGWDVQEFGFNPHKKVQEPEPEQMSLF